MKLPVHFATNSFRRSYTWFRHASKKKKIAVIASTLVVLLIIIGQVQGANATPPYKFAKVQKGNITEVVSETGSITTNGRVDVYSPATGIVEEVFVANGEEVKKGQDLFTVRSSATEQEQSQALANYLTAKSTLDTANATLHTLQAQLFQANQAFIKGKGSTSDPKKDDPDYIQQNATWLAAEANYKKQQAVIQQAQASVASSYLLYQATQNATVRATADGTISNVAATTGTTVKANSPTSPAAPVLSIANFTTTEAVASLSESDISKVREGQRATVDINSADDKEFRGVVRRVDSIGTDEGGVTRYKAYIEVLAASTNLRPGMTADVKIITKEVKDTLIVPNSAVKPYQGGRAVRVLDPKTKEIKFIPIKIGIKGERNTQIISGVSQGTEVITALSNEKLQRGGLFGGS
jgi:HlyD family secretion protein